jgi:mono/diheme cytochrome c family protein
MHIGLAALIGLLLLAHDRKSPAPPEEEKRLGKNRSLWALAAVFILLFAGTTFTPSWFVDPLREAANPTVSPEGVASPWFLLFLQEVFAFVNTAYPVWAVILWSLALILLFGLPYFDRRPEKNLLQRPACLAVGAAMLVGVVYFTLVGMAGAHYGEKVVLPVRNPAPEEVRGAQVYARKNCAYCHQVFGHQGRREGPDMAVVRQRNRSPEWVQRFVLNARLYQPGTTMPKYEIPLEELEALAAYLLALDPTKRGFQAVDREFLLNFGAPAGSWGKGSK